MVLHGVGHKLNEYYSVEIRMNVNYAQLQAHQMTPVVGGQSDPHPPSSYSAPHLGGIFLWNQ